jgi:DNA polymerase-3 subunit delta'
VSTITGLGRRPGSDYLAVVPFDTVQGQPTAVGTLERVLRSGRVHHALRFEGPEGVGKEMAAMALAQALVCTGGNPLGCGVCSACRRAVTLGEGTPAVPLHPDVIFVERGLYPPEVLGRSGPEAKEISVQQIRTVVLERIPFPPHEGRARIFIIRRAEELSISAGNALLKSLEEPGNNTYFVLLVARPARLLSTVQSRSLRIRFAPLPEDVIASVVASRGVSAEVAATVAPLASGSVRTALSLADETASRDRQAFLDQAAVALEAGDPAALLGLADDGGRDKALLREHLEALSAHFARRAREAALAHQPRARILALRYQIVLQALRHMERNASPALLIENMMLRLRAETG